MKTNCYLLPTYFKVIGWIMAIPSVFVLIPWMFMDPYHADSPSPIGSFSDFFRAIWWNIYNMFGDVDFTVTLCMILLMAGLLFIAFSKQKIEDEYIAKLRGDSLIWAVIVDSLLITILSVTVFERWFLYVSFLNLYTVLVLFIIKFNIALNYLKKQPENEE